MTLLVQLKCVMCRGYAIYVYVKTFFCDACGFFSLITQRSQRRLYVMYYVLPEVVTQLKYYFVFGSLTTIGGWIVDDLTFDVGIIFVNVVWSPLSLFLARFNCVLSHFVEAVYFGLRQLPFSSIGTKSHCWFSSPFPGSNVSCHGSNWWPWMGFELTSDLVMLQTAS